MVGTEERFAEGESYHNPATDRPENNCNVTGRQFLWAMNGATYQWETTPVTHNSQSREDTSRSRAEMLLTS